MLVKIFKMNSRNREPGGLDYVMHNDTAQVLRGDPDFCRWVIASTPSTLAQRLTAGVINDLKDLPDAKNEELLDEFEDFLLAGRPKSSMPWCAIEHSDKGKREIHFVIPIYDLFARKPIHPLVDRIDRNGLMAWVEHFALRHDLSLTGEKLRETPAFRHFRQHTSDSIAFLEVVWNQVHQWVKEEKVKCRKGLEKQLVEEGYKVIFRTGTGTQLQQPRIIGPEMESLKLTGSIYYRTDFGTSQVPLDRADKTAVAARLEELRKIIDARMDFRAHHLIGRIFGAKEKNKLKPKDKDQARARFKQLIDDRLALQRNADGLWQGIDFAGASRSAHLIKSGSAKIVENSGNWLNPIPPVGEFQDLPPSASIDPIQGSTPVDDVAIGVLSQLPAAEKAEAEAFQPPSHGMTHVAEIAPVPEIVKPKSKKKIPDYPIME